MMITKITQFEQQCEACLLPWSFDKKEKKARLIQLTVQNMKETPS